MLRNYTYTCPVCGEKYHVMKSSSASNQYPNIYTMYLMVPGSSGPVAVSAGAVSKQGSHKWVAYRRGNEVGTYSNLCRALWQLKADARRAYGSSYSPVDQVDIHDAIIRLGDGTV